MKKLKVKTIRAIAKFGKSFKNKFYQLLNLFITVGNVCILEMYYHSIF